MKKIGIVTSPLSTGHKVRGVGFYTSRLLSSLKLLAPSHNLEIVETDLGACDLIHYPFFDLFTPTLPLFPLKKTVVTVHDVVPLEFPEIYKPGVRGGLNLLLQKSALKNVNMVITDSFASVKSIQRELNILPEKIRLIYLAADSMFKPIQDKKLLQQTINKFHLPKKFILYVGDINWNKNIATLLKASAAINMPVVIVGKQALEIESMDTNHPELQHLLEVKKLLSQHVLRLGFVTNSELVDLYNLATVYCQPSFAEGFGLPVLEALACDTPVVCSRTHSLPEIGGNAVNYFDPHNVQELSEVLQGPYAKDRQQQANKFSWEKTALETIFVYEEVLLKK